MGNFRETLNDCEYLLDDQRYFTKRDGFVSNVSSYYQIDPEVQKLRGRITVHNIKVNRNPSEEVKMEKERINFLASYQFLSKSLTRSFPIFLVGQDLLTLITTAKSQEIISFKSTIQ